MARGNSFGLKVRGGNELRRTMRKAGVDIKRLTKINKAAATTVATAAVPRAPKGTKTRKSRRYYRPGKLAKSIRPGATTKLGMVRAGNNRSVPYANPIHWGWPNRNIKPNMFLYVAAKATEETWVKEYDVHLKKVINEVKGYRGK